jgi:pimeloyl-ACP methyl ester carboxylesterase
MHLAASDERDSEWEKRQSTFRVYFFSGPGPGYSVSTFDDHADDRRYSIALVSSNKHGQRGLVWLIGHDLNGVS